MLNNELRRWYLLEKVVDGSKQLLSITQGDAEPPLMPHKSLTKLTLSEAAPYIIPILVQRLKDVFKDNGHTKAVLGLSGGIDSAVVYALLVRALGVEHVTALLMPNGEQSAKESCLDARMLLDQVRGTYALINIGHSVAALCPFCVYPGCDSEFKTRFGNVAARCRMIVLFDYASATHSLVVGTENKSEHILGYFTLFGDSASCVEPIQGLYKTEVFEIAKHLPEIPQSIIDKKPSADLWAGQTDEGELGFTYLEADKFSCGRGDELSEDVRGRINQRIKSVGFKHRIPYVIPCEGTVPNE